MTSPARKAYLKRWRAENKERRSAYWREWKYGLTPEKHSELLTAQDYKCAVCHKEEPTHVDHCHASGEVRGLLCNSCNVAIGHLRDDPTILTNAIAYLSKV